MLGQSVKLATTYELQEEIQEIARRSPTKTLLWLDPQREWERLLDQLATELELVKYAGSQLELRMKIEVEPAQKSRIVYVPLARQVLSALKEYEFTLPMWDEGLLHALRRWGVGIDHDEEKVLLPLLPNLAGRWSDKSMDYWRHFTASGVRARLFDDEQILVFLADPDSVVADLERDGALAVFRDYLAVAFGGRVVRKDLVKKTKVGFNVPIFVLEYLLGRYCSSTDPSIVAEGLEHVKSIIAERFVRVDEGELIKSRTRQRGAMRLIDKVTVTYRETEDKYGASLANSGLSYVHIAPHLVQQYEKLLVGGVRANVEVRYDDSLQHRGVTRPFTIEQLQPIQIASADLDEYAKVNLSYIDLESGQETFVPCPELGVMQLIPEGQLEPDDVFTVGFDKGEGRFGLFRLQVQATKGNGHLRVTGNPSKPMRDALQTAYYYLRANLRHLGSDRDLKDFDLQIQIQSLMQAKEGSGTGKALFIALLSAVLARPLVPQRVILGDLTIHGVLMRIDSLADKLKAAMDASAKKVMIPTENKRDFADLPADIIDKLQIVFYSGPTNAAFRAMGLE